MKKLLVGIVLALSGCLTYNAPPDGREQDRFRFVEVFWPLGVNPAQARPVTPNGGVNWVSCVAYYDCSEREARYLFAQDYPGVEIAAIFGHFIKPNVGETPNEFKARLLTADEVEEVRNR